VSVLASVKVSVWESSSVIGVGSGVSAGLVSANVSNGGKERRRNFESVLVMRIGRE
jgi:hypothetical protein